MPTAVGNPRQPRFTLALLATSLLGVVPVLIVAGGYLSLRTALSGPSYSDSISPDDCFIAHWSAYDTIFYFALALGLLAQLEARAMGRISTSRWLHLGSVAPLLAGFLSLILATYTISNYVFGSRTNCAWYYNPGTFQDLLTKGILIGTTVIVLGGLIALASHNLRQGPIAATPKRLLNRTALGTTGMALVLFIPLAFLQRDTPPATCWDYTGTQVIQLALALAVVALVMSTVTLMITRQSYLAIAPLLGSIGALVMSVILWALSSHYDRHCYRYIPDSMSGAPTLPWLGLLVIFTLFGSFLLTIIALGRLNLGKRAGDSM